VTVFNTNGIVTRTALPSDREEIARIIAGVQTARLQTTSPGASGWTAEDYLAHDCLVALADDRVTGFIAFRETAPGEREILNLAVDPPFRRRGVARRLMEQVLEAARGTVFLEVRESNRPARNLYETLGFQVIGVRERYYADSGESAIVMKFHSC
jgi:ribosomal-protein-alanine N-acetyltransferase